MRIRILHVMAWALVVAALTTPLQAHMKASKFAPAADATVTTPPTQVQVWFTQAPDPKISRLEMVGPSGAVTLGPLGVKSDKSMAAAIDGSLPDGRYTVRWQSAGDDGHIQRGEFAFTVRRAP